MPCNFELFALVHTLPVGVLAPVIRTRAVTRITRITRPTDQSMAARVTAPHWTQT